MSDSIPTPDRIYWRCTEGGSNKDYITSLEQVDGGLWIASYAFGAHGATLTPGTKMKKGPDTYEKAKKVYDAMVKERISKRYVAQGQSGAAYVAAASDKQHSGIDCQLLNPIEAVELEALFRDPSWWAQPKHFGKRMILRRQAGLVEGVNRKGFIVGYPQAMADAACSLVPTDLVLDGEAVGERLHAFDLLLAGGRDLRAETYAARLAMLTDILAGVTPTAAIIPIETARTETEKRGLYERLRREKAEGIVFKRASAPYTAGRPNSGGTQLKFKFYETCSAVVADANNVRSVALKLFDGVTWVGVGNCTVPPNQPVPAPGTVVEVRYLHAYKGGALYEPSYLGERTDIDPGECLLSQLKYKGGDASEADAAEVADLAA